MGVAVGVADLGARVRRPPDRSPARLDAVRLEVRERALHVLDLERHHPVAQAFARSSLLHPLFRITHELEVVDLLEHR
jgi:hypothetical protein